MPAFAGDQADFLAAITVITGQSKPADDDALPVAAASPLR
jgi:hypothetical protein